jgi:hypothetical protein
VFAQVDPQAMLGVWEGHWSYREQRGIKSGPITITINKIESGKVHGKTEVQGSQENSSYNWVADVTSTGYTFTSKEGNTTTGTLHDGRLRVISGRGGRVTSVLDKR